MIQHILEKSVSSVTTRTLKDVRSKDIDKELRYALWFGLEPILCLLIGKGSWKDKEKETAKERFEEKEKEKEKGKELAVCPETLPDASNQEAES